MTGSYSDLAGKVVVVTGGATGIGAAMVEAFARQGAIACFVDTNMAAGHGLSDALDHRGQSAPFALCDVTRTRDLQAAIQRFARQHGPIQVLINNAANDKRHTLADLTPDGFDENIAVNLRHQLFAAQVVAPMMRGAGGGSIINLSSIGWMTGGAEYPVYAAAKAAVHGLTRALARDLGRDKIRVNTISPGWVMTDRQRRLWLDDAGREKIARSQALPGELLPEDIAEMALFLGSDASRMCTAQNYIVDGGWA